ncbi:unnamed protein product [Haemonchus placei]|uniref:Thymidine kinase n=1 Tax=Haemonchus placei TaxID=6290 RepID=A0A3P7ZQQ5_HAEPC|nr:unnamed protein product [Haemonchus placei]
MGRKKKIGYVIILVQYSLNLSYETTGQGITVKAYKLSEVEEQIFDPSVQVVSIDEGQFFSDCAETCDKLACMGKVVYVAALSGTFERKPFPQVSLLLPYADEIKQVVAVCVGCGSDASYSFRNTLDKKVEVIGGEDTYRALCRSCYIEESCRREEEATEVTVSENQPAATETLKENAILGLVASEKRSKSTLTYSTSVGKSSTAIAKR